MTDEAKIAVAEALERAAEAARAAEQLLAVGLHRDAVSRAYYAAFHVVQAALRARGLEVRTHGGAFQLFHREFVKTGLATRVPGWQLAGLQRSREMADYDSSTTFTADEVRTLLGIVGAFTADVTAMLDREGFLGKA
ncbi:MAG: HEPN domain-containing protein [Planctomycetes bacterium]|nr:HEPN domain-containing protein [Planctomycetota bacterium]